MRGSMDKPIVGVSVEMVAAGEQKGATARTDGEGRATIPNLKAGVSYRARVVVDNQTIASESFTMPAQGGVRLLLSAGGARSDQSPAALTAEPADDEEGADMAEGDGGAEGAASEGTAAGAEGDGSIPPMMRDPRRISGQARPESKDPGGRLTVRTVQGKFRSSEAGLTSDVPKGVPVHLVGYQADGKVTLETGHVGEDGRVVFDNLSRGSTAYYVLAQFPRAAGVDRLASQPVRMLPEVGLRMMLAGLARDAATAGADDLPRLDQPAAQPPAGNVLVRLNVSPDKRAQIDAAREFELVDAASGKVVSRAAVRPFRPSPDDVTAQVLPVTGTEMKLSAGEVGVGVYRPSFNQGVPGVGVELRTADAPEVIAKASTDARGFHVFRGLKLDPKRSYVVVATVHGKQAKSSPFSLEAGKSTGFAFAVDWAEGELEGTFSAVPGGPHRVYYARLKLAERAYLTVPFQLTDKFGAALNILIYPDVLFGFHGGGLVEDDKLWFQLRLLFQNPGQTPYLPPGGQIAVPLPRGFVGASLPEEGKSSMKIVPDQGLAWKGALPPGMSDVVVDFAVPIEGGRAQIDWDLPNGVARGQLMVSDLPGMVLAGIPADVRPRSTTLEDGRSYKVLDNIQIEPGKRLSFSLRNLPQAPPWNSRMRWVAGIAVLGLFGWALVSTLNRRRARIASTGQRELAQRRGQLLDELVRLEGNQRKGRVSEEEYRDKRGRLMRELEAIFSALGEGSK
jgi:hypothetical protein